MKKILICFMSLVPFMLYGGDGNDTVKVEVEWSSVIKIDTCFTGYDIYGDVKEGKKLGGEEDKYFKGNVLEKNDLCRYIFRNASQGIFVVIPEEDAKKMKLFGDSSKVCKDSIFDFYFPDAVNTDPGKKILCLRVCPKIESTDSCESCSPSTNNEDGVPVTKKWYLSPSFLSVFAFILGGVIFYALGRKRHHKDSLPAGALNPPISTARAYDKDLLKEDVVPRLRELKEALNHMQVAMTNLPVQMSNEVKVPILNELRKMEGQMNARKVADVAEHVMPQLKQKIELDYSDGKLNVGGNKFFYVTGEGRNDALQLYVNEDKRLRELLKGTFRESYVDVIDFKPIDINGEECIEPGCVQKSGGNYVIMQKVVWHYPSYV